MFENIVSQSMGDLNEHGRWIKVVLLFLEGCVDKWILTRPCLEATDLRTL